MSGLLAVEQGHWRFGKPWGQEWRAKFLPSISDRFGASPPGSVCRGGSESEKGSV